MTADRANAAAMVTGGGRMSPAISAIPLDPGIAQMKLKFRVPRLSFLSGSKDAPCPAMGAG